jgi:hypothetical protein
MQGEQSRSGSCERRRWIIRPPSSRPRSRSPVIIQGESRRYRSRSPQEVIMAGESRRPRSRSPQQVIVAGPSERPRSSQPIIIDGDRRHSRPGFMSRIFGGSRHSRSPRCVIGRPRSRTPPIIIDPDRRRRSYSPSRRCGSRRERSPPPVIIASSRRSRSYSPRRLERRERSPVRIYKGDGSRCYHSRSPRRRCSYSPRRL